MVRTWNWVEWMVKATRAGPERMVGLAAADVAGAVG
jgi:hypothetical protein